MLLSVGNIFRNLGNQIYLGFNIVGLFVFILLLVTTIVFSILKIKKLNTTAAILVSSLLCSFWMIPITGTIGHLVKITASSEALSVANEKIRLAAIEEENRKLEEEATKREAEIKRQQQIIDSYKHAQFSLQSFNEILEVGLLKTEMSMTKYDFYDINEKYQNKKKIFILTDENNLRGKKYLGVYTHDLTVKHGIDLNKITVKEDKDKIIVGMIKPKYIGTEKDINNIVFNEIMIHDIEKYSLGTKQGEIDTYIIQNDEKHKLMSDQLAKEHENEFKNNLKAGVETKFLNESIIKLGQKFIQLALSPLFNEEKIVFEKFELDDGIPIMEYINNKVKEEQSKLPK